MTTRQPGGAWVLASPSPNDVFTPEDFSDEQRQLGAAIRSFVEHEVLPVLPAIEQHEFSHTTRLLFQAGELGLTGIEVPEQYGGAGGDKVMAALALDQLGAAGSFTTSFAAHTGIGTLPIVYFGTAAQRAKYLPKLASAEHIASYCLTESGSGSDALGAKATARLSADGTQWILNGAKQWITNSGFADIFIVYAKVDGEKFSAFIVERETPGLSTGREENKMGIRGSSTRTVTFEDCAIPVENLLHEVGKGHHIAFNILNVGRYKLGAATIGAARTVLNLSAAYAKERKQFGRSIAEFPLIQQKIADMAVRLYAAESAGYRTASLLNGALSGIDLDDPGAVQHSIAGLQEYVVECSIMKVLGSEVLDFIVDEGVQIHGGYGYMEDFPVCRAYRDSRINRIFEGTNEINRLLITGDLLRRAMKGQLPLMAAVMNLQNELLSYSPAELDETPLAQERAILEAARKAALLVAGLAVQKYGQAIEREQEQLAGIADILIEMYGIDSALLRSIKHPSDLHRDLAIAHTHDAFNRIEQTARTLLSALTEGDELRTQLAVLRRLTRREPLNSIALKRSIAATILAEGYRFPA